MADQGKKAKPTEDYLQLSREQNHTSEDTRPVKFRILEDNVHNQTLTPFRRSTLRMHVLKNAQFKNHEQDNSDTESVCSTQSAPVRMLTDPRYHVKASVTFRSLKREKMEPNTVKPLFTRTLSPSIQVELEGGDDAIASQRQHQLLNSRRALSNSNLAAFDLAGNTTGQLRRASSINLPPIARTPTVPNKEKLNSLSIQTKTTRRSHDSLIQSRDNKVETPSHEPPASRSHGHNHPSPCERCLHRHNSVSSLIAQTFGAIHHHDHQKPVKNRGATIVDELLHIDEIRRLSDRERIDDGFKNKNGNGRGAGTEQKSKSLADMFGELQDCRYLRNPNNKEPH